MHANVGSQQLPDPSTSSSRQQEEPYTPSSCFDGYLHGPALEDDHPNQIYDNWAGLLAAAKTTHMSSSNPGLQHDDEVPELEDEIAGDESSDEERDEGDQPSPAVLNDS